MTRPFPSLPPNLAASSIPEYSEQPTAAPAQPPAQIRTTLHAMLQSQSDPGGHCTRWHISAALRPPAPRTPQPNLTAVSLARVTDPHVVRRGRVRDDASATRHQETRTPKTSQLGGLPFPGPPSPGACVPWLLPIGTLGARPRVRSWIPLAAPSLQRNWPMGLGASDSGSGSSAGETWWLCRSRSRGS